MYNLCVFIGGIIINFHLQMGSVCLFFFLWSYYFGCSYAGMLKTQRQNLIMENEFHIKEERVKAQQSSVKSQDSKESTSAASVNTATTDGSEKNSGKTYSSSKVKATKPDSGGESKVSSKELAATGSAKTASVSAKTASGSAKTASGSARKDGSSNAINLELSSGNSTKNGTIGGAEKQMKEKLSGEEGMVKRAAVSVGGEENSAPSRDVAPSGDMTATDQCSSTSPPVSRTSIPSRAAAVATSGEGKRNLPVPNGPIERALSPKTSIQRRPSPDITLERGKCLLLVSLSYQQLSVQRSSCYIHCSP